MTGATMDTDKPLDLVWFAGGGGSSEGLAAAGFPPDYALNHNAVALLMHQANHPGCVHLVDDATAVHPMTLEPGRHIRSFWASPDCTHFSVARGSAPKSPRIRGLAWCILPWAEQRRPDVIFVENVKEFTTWGPLDDAGQPIKARAGETFREWVGSLEAAGYVVVWKVLNCADYGAPTTRKRLFVIARCDGQPISWPERTHAPRKEAAALGLKPYVSAASCIDWAEPCPSIFLTQAEAKAAGLNVKRPLVKATQARIAKGIERYIIGSAEPFIVQLTHQGDRRRLDPQEPFPTVTGAHRGEIAAVVPTMAMISNQYTSNTSGGRSDPREPKKTITSANHHAVVEMPLQAAMVTKFQENSIGQHPADALDTVMAGATRFGVVSASLGRQFGRSIGSDAGEPVGSITAGGGGKTQVVAATLGRQFGTNEAGADIAEPVGAITGQGGGGKTQVITANLTTYYSSGDNAHDISDPLRTTTGTDRHGLSAVFLEQANTGLVGHDARDGLSTVTGRATQQRVIEARLAAMGAAPGARRRQVLEFLWAHFGEPTEAEWAAPTATDKGRLRFGLVIAIGQVWEIADIGMRMLKPRELFNAQGFRPDYIIDRDPYGGPINTTQATLMVGNSVPPPMAEALAAANLIDDAEPERVAA